MPLIVDQVITLFGGEDAAWASSSVSRKAWSV